MVPMASVAAKAMTPTSACSSKSRPPLHRAAGFTLLEIMLVLAILALASVLVVPNLGNLETRTFSAQVRQATSLLNHARRMAVVEGQPRVASFYAAGADETALPEAQASVGTWHAGAATTLGFRDSTEQESAIDDLLEISFFPEGGSTGGTLLLEQDGQRLAIAIDPFTGRVNLITEEE